MTIIECVKIVHPFSGPPCNLKTIMSLTHWGRVTHICVSKLTIIGSNNGLSPERRQAIIWNNAGILLIGPLGTNFSEILIKIQTFSLKKIRLKLSSTKCRPFCLGLNVLMLLQESLRPWRQLPESLHSQVTATLWGIGDVEIPHYNDVIMSMTASQITSFTIVYSTVYSGVDQREHHSSVSLAFVRGIHRWPVNSPHKWPVTRKMFPYDDVIMIYGPYVQMICSNLIIWQGTRIMIPAMTARYHDSL